jgi:transposase
MRYDEKWTRLAVRLSARGKPVSLISAAVANRWMRWLFHQMQPGQLAA